MVNIKKIIKLTAFVVCIVFTCNTVVFSSPSFVYKLNVPAEFGRISSRWQSHKNDLPDKSKPTIIIIQDAHENLDAQKNIAQIVQSLVPQVDIERTFFGAEGAVGNLSCDELRDYPIKKARIRAAESLMKDGYLTGLEFAAVTSDKRLKVYGVEDAVLFKKNFQEFYASVSERDRIEVFFCEIEQYFEKIKAAVLSAFLSEIDKHVSEYYRGESSFESIIAFLIDFSLLRNIDLSEYTSILLFNEIIKLEALQKKEALHSELNEISINTGFDFSGENCCDLSVLDIAWAKISLPENSKQCKYKHLYAARKLMKKKALLDISQLFCEVYSALEYLMSVSAKTADEKEIVRLYFDFIVLKNIHTLKASQNDLKRSVKDIDVFINDLNVFGKKFAVDEFIFKMPDVVKNNQAFSFYKNADERDKVMLDNMLSHLEKHDFNTGVLVAGGYHTRGISELLREKNISYLILTPELSFSENTNGYMNRMLGKLAPLDPVMTSYIHASRINALMETVCGSVGERVVNQIFGRVWKNEIAKSKSWASIIYLLKDDLNVRPDVREKAQAFFDVAVGNSDRINDGDDVVGRVEKLLKSDKEFAENVKDIFDLEIEGQAKWSKYTFEKTVGNYIKETGEQRLAEINRVIKGARDVFNKNIAYWGYKDWADFVVKNNLGDDVRRSWTAEYFDSVVEPYIREKGIYILAHIGLHEKGIETAFNRGKNTWGYSSWNDYLEKKGFVEKGVLDLAWTREYALYRLRWCMHFYGVDFRQSIKVLDPALVENFQSSNGDWGIGSWDIFVKQAKQIILDDKYNSFCKSHEKYLKIKGIDVEKQLLAYEEFLDKKEVVRTENEKKAAKKLRDRKKKYDLNDKKDFARYQTAIRKSQRDFINCIADIAYALTNDNFLKSIIEKMLLVPATEEKTKCKFESIVNNKYLTQEEVDCLLKMEPLLIYDVRKLADKVNVNDLIKRLQRQISVMRKNNFSDSEIENSLINGFSFKDLHLMAINAAYKKTAVDFARVKWSRKAISFRKKHMDISFPKLKTVLEIKEGEGEGVAANKVCICNYEGVRFNFGLSSPLGRDIKAGNVMLTCNNKKIIIHNKRTAQKWIFTIDNENQLCYNKKKIEGVFFRSSGGDTVFVNLTNYMFSKYEFAVEQFVSKIINNPDNRKAKIFRVGCREMLEKIGEFGDEIEEPYKEFFYKLAEETGNKSLRYFAGKERSSEEMVEALELFFSDKKSQVKKMLEFRLWVCEPCLSSVLQKNDFAEVEKFFTERFGVYFEYYGMHFMQDLFGVSVAEPDEFMQNLRSICEDLKSKVFEDFDESLVLSRKTVVYTGKRLLGEVVFNFVRMLFYHNSVLREHIKAGNIEVLIMCGGVICFENKVTRKRTFFDFGLNDRFIYDRYGNVLFDRKNASEDKTVNFPANMYLIYDNLYEYLIREIRGQKDLPNALARARLNELLKVVETAHKHGLIENWQEGTDAVGFLDGMSGGKTTQMINKINMSDAVKHELAKYLCMFSGLFEPLDEMTDSEIKDTLKIIIPEYFKKYGDTVFEDVFRNVDMKQIIKENLRLSKKLGFFKTSRSDGNSFKMKNVYINIGLYSSFGVDLSRGNIEYLVVNDFFCIKNRRTCKKWVFRFSDDDYLCDVFGNRLALIEGRSKGDSGIFVDIMKYIDKADESEFIQFAVRNFKERNFERSREATRKMMNMGIKKYSEVTGSDDFYGFAKAVSEAVNDVVLCNFLRKKRQEKDIRDFMLMYYSCEREKFREQIADKMQLFKGALYPKLSLPEQSFESAVFLYLGEIFNTYGMEISSILFPEQTGDLRACFKWVYDTYLPEKEIERKIMDTVFGAGNAGAIAKGTKALNTLNGLNVDRLIKIDEELYARIDGNLRYALTCMGLSDEEENMLLRETEKLKNRKIDIKGFISIFEDASDYVLGRFNRNKERLYVAVDFIDWLRAQGLESLVDEYLFHEFVCDVIGHGHAIKLARKIFPYGG